jgi:TfoX/Sxy family transcriptional regulator of competence genes
MGSSPVTLELILSKIGPEASLTARKMFGEYALYCDEKVVALIADDRLFVKASPVGGEFLGPEHEAPAYPGAKNSLLVPLDRLDDREWLTRFIVRTAEALPAAKPKKKKG